jgi:hypothetical protein
VGSLFTILGKSMTTATLVAAVSVSYPMSAAAAVTAASLSPSENTTHQDDPEPSPWASSPADDPEPNPW